jgi:hypothetical protein
MKRGKKHPSTLAEAFWITAMMPVSPPAAAQDGWETAPRQRVGHLPPVARRKVLPMCPVRGVTYVSGRSDLDVRNLRHRSAVGTSARSRIELCQRRQGRSAASCVASLACALDRFFELRHPLQLRGASHGADRCQSNRGACSPRACAGRLRCAVGVARRRLARYLERTPHQPALWRPVHRPVSGALQRVPPTE